MNDLKAQSPFPDTKIKIVRMADMFDFELHEDERADQDQQACCESDDDIIEIDDVSPKVVMGTGLFLEYFGCLFGEYIASWLSVT